jgi:transposase-like protein
MAKRKRRRFSPEEKFNIVKQVLSKAKTVSEISEEYDIHPNQYYQWQKDFFNGA